MKNTAVIFSVILALLILPSCKPGQTPDQPEKGTKAAESSQSTIKDNTTQPSDIAPAPTVSKTAIEDKAVDKESAESFIKLGISYSKEGKYEEAIEAYRQAIQMLESDTAEIHYNLAHAHLMLYDEAAAHKEYRHLRTIDPVLAEKLYAFATSRTLEDQSGKFLVQVGAYKKNHNADVMLDTLKSRSFNAFVHREGNFSMVRIAGIKTRKDGVALMNSLTEELKVAPYLLNRTH